MIKLTSGSVSIAIDPERGGRLASLIVGGSERLLGPPTDADRSVGWGCYVMAPWPGRLAGGRLPWLGTIHQLEPTLDGHAIHGVVYGRPWTVDEAATTTEARLSAELDAGGWPFGGSVEQRFELGPNDLTLEATIKAKRSMPAALGWHPWFLRGDGDARVAVDADGVLETEGLIPTGAIVPFDAETDLRDGPVLGERRLDHTYVGVRSPAVITWPDLEVRIEFEPAVSAVVVYTPPGMFCVEPQTAWPNALGMDERDGREGGAARLDAGQELRTRIRLTW